MTYMDTINTQLLTTRTQTTSPTAASTASANLSTGFADLINQALAGTEAASSAAGAENAALLTGENTNIHQVVLAAEKAEVALRLTLQVRNKVLDAYKEIMQMQV